MYANVPLVHCYLMICIKKINIKRIDQLNNRDLAMVSLLNPWHKQCEMLWCFWKWYGSTSNLQLPIVTNQPQINLWILFKNCYNLLKLMSNQFLTRTLFFLLHIMLAPYTNHLSIYYIQLVIVYHPLSLMNTPSLLVMVWLTIRE